MKPDPSVEVLRGFQATTSFLFERIFWDVSARCNPKGSVSKDKDVVMKSEVIHICDLSLTKHWTQNLGLFGCCLVNRR